ncbi:MAG: bifunctional (p)ppGpp synthetase/guanosine-3',5'-bis(diphosphate) 3'-pyrophosphohydrolase, partial [Burkholderiales bacterium]
MSKKQKSESAASAPATHEALPMTANAVVSAASTWLAASCDEQVLARGRATAELIEDLRIDEISVAAAWLSAAPAELATETKLKEMFGVAVCELVAGVQRMASIQELSRTRGDSPPRDKESAKDAANAAQQTEALRKMLLAMVDDVRVVLIKLAERLVSLRAAALSPDARRSELAQAEARDVRDIFAPLANRLGVWRIKWELEDLSLRLLEPEQFHKISRYLDETRIEREAYIDTAKARIRDAVGSAG